MTDGKGEGEERDEVRGSAVPELKNRENESPEVSCVRRLNMVGEKQEPNWNEWK